MTLPSNRLARRKLFLFIYTFRKKFHIVEKKAPNYGWNVKSLTLSRDIKICYKSLFLNLQAWALNSYVNRIQRSVRFAVIKSYDLRLFFNFKFYCLSTVQELRILEKRAKFLLLASAMISVGEKSFFSSPFTHNKFQYFSHAMKTYLIK